MSDAEVKDLNQISKKDIYHTPSGKYIQFIHDHSEKTFDAWELLPDGSHWLLESQSTTIETFDEFSDKSTHNRRERPVYGHRGGSRGRFYYRITTFEERPWDARDPH